MCLAYLYQAENTECPKRRVPAQIVGRIRIEASDNEGHYPIGAAGYRVGYWLHFRSHQFWHHKPWDAPIPKGERRDEYAQAGDG